jgi:crossover junction endodeoxyribonuclease RuvC
MRIIGIDPGARGALALLDGGNVVDVWDTPITHMGTRGGTKVRIDPARFADIVRGTRADHAFVERVGAMPGQGVSSMFAFGKAVGIAEGILAALGVPATWITPAEWKGGLRVPADKDAARARASQLLPRSAHHWPLVKHDGRAEACLLALYGSRRDGLAPRTIEW